MVIAAAIIGGTALSGGSGSIIGAFIGTLLIMTIRNGIVHLGVSAYWSATVTGFVIIAAVATLVERIPGIDDNITVPIVTALLVY